MRTPRPLARVTLPELAEMVKTVSPATAETTLPRFGVEAEIELTENVCAPAAWAVNVNPQPKTNRTIV